MVNYVKYEYMLNWHPHNAYQMSVGSLHSLSSYISTNQNYLTVLTISLKSNTNVFALPLRNVEHNALGNSERLDLDNKLKSAKIRTTTTY
jgi:hypothetical protein